MNFTITITGEGAELAKALQALKAATDGQHIVSGEVTAVVDTDKPKRTAKPKTESEPEKPAAVEEEQVENGEVEQVSADLGEIPSVVELRAKAQEVGTTGDKKKAIKALLDKFGFASISNVPEDMRIAFMAELELI